MPVGAAGAAAAGRHHFGRRPQGGTSSSGSGSLGRTEGARGSSGGGSLPAAPGRPTSVESAASAQSAIYTPISSGDGVPPQSHGQQRTPLIGKLRYVAPGLLFLVTALYQSAARYVATAVYVSWMDELERIEQANFEERRLEEDVTRASSFRPLSKEPGYSAPSTNFSSEGVVPSPLEQTESSVPSWGWPGNQPLSLVLPDSVGASFGGRHFDTSWFEVLCFALMLSFLAIVVHVRDLRLWTRVMLTLSLCNMLKGMLTWSTVVPDIRGWDGCQKDLGQNLLQHYRTIKTEEISMLAAMWSDLGFELDSFWMYVASQFQRWSTLYCTESFFSAQLCSEVVLCLGLYEAFCKASENFGGGERRRLKYIVGTLLAITILVDVSIKLLNSYAYTANLVVSVCVALLIYSNPAVALVTERWAVPTTHAREAWPLLEAMIGTETGEEDVQPRESLPADVGQSMGNHAELLVPPCCIPFCAFSGIVYLQNKLLQVPKSPVGATEDRRRRLALILQACQEVEQMKLKLTKTAEQEEAADALREAEAAAVAKRAVAEALAQDQARLQSEGAMMHSQATEGLEKVQMIAAEHERTVECKAKEASDAEGRFSRERKELQSSVSEARLRAQAMRAQIDAMREQLGKVSA
eukprot:TRINITY_DN48206_c0_g1_i1.p1 TRINITY_DN48206_c0_g1~~TRINITY_DN48206_c0_g1_i1.p1  ORF type:complete len:638 (+),score=106.47 TRINITY_DN48206_c0_g1_i1:286-2199(+)